MTYMVYRKTRRPMRRPRRYRPRKYKRSFPNRALIQLKASKPNCFTDTKSIVNIGSAIPRAIKGLVVVADVMEISLGTTVPAIRYCLLNSLYDPLSTSGTRQGYGYDKLSPLYRAYYVYGVTVTIKIRTVSDLSPIRCAWGLTGQDYYTSSQDISGCQYGDTGLITKTSPYTIRFYADLFKVAGLKRSRDMQDNPFSASIGSDPTIKAWLNLIVENVTSSTQTVYVYFEFEQHYVMFDSKQATLEDG